MSIREKITAGLISLGLILAFLPLSGNRSFIVNPEKLLSDVLREDNIITVDQVARYVVTEDSTIRIIDLRSADQFLSANIPGSVNLPYDEMVNSGAAGFPANTTDIKTILYSNGDISSNYALVMALGMNYKNVFVMKGGLNEWYKTVMNSSFTGERITARENAVFETRTRAKKLFTEINSLPDSLKIKYLESKKLEAQKLDGGCE